MLSMAAAALDFIKGHDTGPIWKLKLVADIVIVKAAVAAILGIE